MEREVVGIIHSPMTCKGQQRRRKDEKKKKHKHNHCTSRGETGRVSKDGITPNRRRETGNKNIILLSGEKVLQEYLNHECARECKTGDMKKTISQRNTLSNRGRKGGKGTEKNRLFNNNTLLFLI